MKTLILMRHGDAPITPTHSDHERELSLKGETDTRVTATHIAEHHNIDFILCSDSKRTMQTLDVLKPKIKNAEIEYSNIIYKKNDVQNLTNLIALQDDKYKTILMIGHNPSLLELAVHYSPNLIDTNFQDIVSGFKTSQIIALNFLCDSWHETLTADAKMIDIFTP
jgi:phosphohistidine phosphatase